MSWTYRQSTGQLLDPSGTTIADGYSGSGIGKNNPDMQNVPDVGPIPRGVYSIGNPHNTETHGPFVMSLTPSTNNEMYSRAGFLIHGDSLLHLGTASQGCIILSLKIRQAIWQSQDQELIVVT